MGAGLRRPHRAPGDAGAQPRLHHYVVDGQRERLWLQHPRDVRQGSRARWSPGPLRGGPQRRYRRRHFHHVLPCVADERLWRASVPQAAHQLRVRSLHGQWPRRPVRVPRGLRSLGLHPRPVYLGMVRPRFGCCDRGRRCLRYVWWRQRRLPQQQQLLHRWHGVPLAAAESGPH